ncbi:hypothetical protein [Mesobacillus jeotgali]|uniref:hypothetical protein n=1 Tax=Mesobacillus jeotgali TaxID=129985 RepID=UPI001116AC0E|nr:hypothetical protein [Mesobacillus jeotgali]
MPEKWRSRRFRSEAGGICARKMEEQEISVRSERNMCPKNGGAGDFGQKQEEYVPEKWRSRRFRSEAGGTCARKMEEQEISVRSRRNMCPKNEQEISVRSRRNMCPKNGGAGDFGNK